MHRNEPFEWMEIAAAATTLTWDAAGVVALRMHKAALGGPEAQKEGWRMCSEKLIAFAELQASLATGSLGLTPAAAARGSLKHYARKVAANRRRLSKASKLLSQ